MKYRLLVVICLTISLLHGVPSYAFEINVHEQISINAIDSTKSGLNGYLSSIGLSNGVDESIGGKRIRVWIEEGSKQEDEPLLDFRYLNHFYNPLDGKGLHDGIFTGKSSYEWASSDQGNLWSWALLHQYYHTGLVHQDPNQRAIFLSKAFRSLGQIMHLVQDLGSPAHVRNDGHPSGDGLEAYTNRSDIINSLNYSSYNFANALASVSPYTPRQFWDSDTYTPQNPNPSSSNTQGLAEYTNSNFASDDTIFTENNLNDWNPLNDNKSFPHPASSETVLYDEFMAHNETIGYDVYRRYFFKTNAGGEEIKHFAYAGRLYKYYVTGATDWEKTLGLDDQCYKDYARQLLPRAVGYSAGLINYFFRGKVNVEKDPQNAGKYIIKNESGEKMEGTFAFYYDDASENRNAVPGASWILSINPNSASSPITFTEPTSPAPKEKGKYILVFQGKLGAEEGAVVGREVKIEDNALILYAVGSEYKTYNPTTKEVKAYNGIFKGATGKIIWREDGKAAIAVFSETWTVVDVEKGKKRGMLSSNYTYGGAGGGWRGDKAVMMGLDTYGSKIYYWEGTVDSGTLRSYSFPEGIRPMVSVVRPLASVATSWDGKEISYNGSYNNDKYYVVSFDTVNRTFATALVGGNQKVSEAPIVLCEDYSGASTDPTTYTETKYPVLMGYYGTDSRALYRDTLNSYNVTGSNWDAKHRCYELQTNSSSLKYTYDILGEILSGGEGKTGWTYSSGNYYIREWVSSRKDFNPLDYIMMSNGGSIVTYTKDEWSHNDDYFRNPPQLYAYKATPCIYFGGHICSDSSIEVQQIWINGIYNGTLINLDAERNKAIGYIKSVVTYGYKPTASQTSKMVFYISNGVFRDITNEHEDFQNAAFFAFVKKE